MKDFKDMTDKEVQIEYSYVAHAVNDTDTFTQEDCCLYELLTEELKKRGFEITTNYIFVKSEEWRL